MGDSITNSGANPLLLLKERIIKTETLLEKYASLTQKFNDLEKSYSESVESEKKAKKDAVKYLHKYCKLVKKFDCQSDKIKILEDNISAKSNELKESKDENARLESVLQVYKLERKSNQCIKKDKDLLLTTFWKVLKKLCEEPKDFKLKKITDNFFKRFEKDVTDLKLEDFRHKKVKKGSRGKRKESELLFSPGSQVLGSVESDFIDTDVPPESVKSSFEFDENYFVQGISQRNIDAAYQNYMKAREINIAENLVMLPDLTLGPFSSVDFGEKIDSNVPGKQILKDCMYMHASEDNGFNLRYDTKEKGSLTSATSFNFPTKGDSSTSDIVIKNNVQDQGKSFQNYPNFKGKRFSSESKAKLREEKIIPGKSRKTYCNEKFNVSSPSHEILEKKVFDGCQLTNTTDSPDRDNAVLNTIDNIKSDDMDIFNVSNEALSINTGVSFNDIRSIPDDTQCSGRFYDEDSNFLFISGNELVNKLGSVNFDAENQESSKPLSASDVKASGICMPSECVSDKEVANSCEEFNSNSGNIINLREVLNKVLEVSGNNAIIERNEISRKSENESKVDENSLKISNFSIKESNFSCNFKQFFDKMRGNKLPNSEVTQQENNISDEEVYRVLRDYRNVPLLSPLSEKPHKRRKSLVVQNTKYDIFNESHNKSIKVLNFSNFGILHNKSNNNKEEEKEALLCNPKTDKERVKTMADKVVQTDGEFLVQAEGEEMEWQSNGTGEDIVFPETLFKKLCKTVRKRKLKKVRYLNSFGKLCKVRSCCFDFMKTLLEMINRRRLHLKNETENSNSTNRKTDDGNLKCDREVFPWHSEDATMENLIFKTESLSNQPKVEDCSFFTRVSYDSNDKLSNSSVKSEKARNKKSDMSLSWFKSVQEIRFETPKRRESESCGIDCNCNACLERGVDSDIALPPSNLNDTVNDFENRCESFAQAYDTAEYEENTEMSNFENNLEIDTKSHDSDTPMTKAENSENSVEGGNTESRSREACSERENTDSRSREACSERENTDSRSREACSERENTDSRSREACSERENIDSRSREACSERENTDSRSRDACSEKENTDSRSRDACSEKENTDSRSREASPEREESDSRSREACSEKENTDSRSREACSERENTDSRSREACSERENTDSRSREACSERENTDSRSRDACSEKENTDSRSREACSEKENTDSRSRDACSERENTDSRSREASPEREESDSRSREASPEREESDSRSREASPEREESASRSREASPEREESASRSREASPEREESASLHESSSRMRGRNALPWEEESCSNDLVLSPGESQSDNNSDNEFLGVSLPPVNGSSMESRGASSGNSINDVLPTEEAFEGSIRLKNKFEQLFGNFEWQSDCFSPESVEKSTLSSAGSQKQMSGNLQINATRNTDTKAVSKKRKVSCDNSRGDCTSNKKMKSDKQSIDADEDSEEKFRKNEVPMNSTFTSQDIIADDNCNILDSIMTAMTKQNEYFKVQSTDAITEANNRNIRCAPQPSQPKDSSNFDSVHPKISKDRRIKVADNASSNQPHRRSADKQFGNQTVKEKMGGNRSAARRHSESDMRSLVQNEIRKFIKLNISTVEEGEEKVKSCIAVLRRANEHIISSVMVGEIMENVDEELKEFERPAPPLTQTQHRIMIILTIFSQSKDQFNRISHKILRSIGSKIFPENFFWPDDSLEMATRFYAALCKKMNNFKRIWRFCFKAITNMRKRWCIPILSVLQVWPDIIYNANKVESNIMVKTFVNIVLHSPKTDDPKRRRYDHKLLAIKHLLINFYNFDVNSTIEDFTKKLWESFIDNVKGSLDSLVLLSKCRTWSWTRKHVIGKFLESLESWMKGNSPNSMVSKVLDVLQEITCIFPKARSPDASSVNDIILVLNKVLIFEKYPIWEEKIIKILCTLCNYADAREILVRFSKNVSTSESLCAEIQKALTPKTRKAKKGSDATQTRGNVTANTENVEKKKKKSKPNKRTNRKRKYSSQGRRGNRQKGKREEHDGC